MAGADYLTCGECGIRICYDGDKTIRENLGWKPVFCGNCWVKMKKKILLFEKQPQICSNIEAHNRPSDAELLMEFWLCDESLWLLDEDIRNAIKRLQNCHDKKLQDYGIFEDKKNNQD